MVREHRGVVGRSQTVRLEGGRRRSGGLRRHRDRADARKPFGSDGVIASMTVTAAGDALLLDVGDFPARGHFAVPADDAAAGECGEAENPNETHDVLRA